MFIMPGMENFAPERTLTSSGFVGVAQLLADLLLPVSPSACAISWLISSGTLLLVLEIDVADFGGDREARRHRHARAAHLGQPGALAAEHILHLSVAVGRAAAKCYKRI